jgi:sialidase-1
VLKWTVVVPVLVVETFEALVSLRSGFETSGTSEMDDFLGEPKFSCTQLFENDRFPNVVVTVHGTVLLIWGERCVRALRSEDGGATWGQVITIAESGIHAGGAVVDEGSGSGSIVAFVEERHPLARLRVYRSIDDGLTWTEDGAAVLKPDLAGRIPSMHMNEHGICLQHGKHRGRLLRCSRWYGEGDSLNQFAEHFTNAVYSDDGGTTWLASEPFPATGTGEAALAELIDGSIYYNSRRHCAPDGVDNKRRWIARSNDGGQTWSELQQDSVLPDGPQDDECFGLFGGLARLPIPFQDVLVFSNCDHKEWRQTGAVWASLDGGQTWPHMRQVFGDESFAYSSLFAGRAGTPSQGWIYCFFEQTDFGPGNGHLARFNLAWLMRRQGQAT